ncbi:ACT domain-containing protein [Pseudovibrio sp. SPO723]|uniref:ACT domain-containing protein n=1 Tax=Nesiotobacter zosterae TaxID=392721 RepID=UPI0029C1D662|nr:ACT domain-containing protein [Pseudovibrio sp. SPO723]MDX5594494.1 ACT domain-containing protein [Pseudovibrio sp. SPO723]
MRINTSRGLRDLGDILKHLEATLEPHGFVFASFPRLSLSEVAQYDPIGTFQEGEEITAILTVEQAGVAGAPTEPVFRHIALSVHSSLEAVGLTAAIANALAAEGIPANVVAGYYHDHVFVPEERAEEALEAIRSLKHQAD